MALPHIDRARATPLDPELAAALEAGAMVLTSTARAARALRRDHSEAQRERGLTAWASPSIRDWAAWVADLWQQHALATDVPLVLTSMQEHALWLRVQQLSGQVVAPDRLAELAADAYRLLGTYSAYAQRRTGWPSHEDASRFAEWADSFDQLCRRNRWLSASDREEQLAAAVRAGQLPAPPEILLAGFDRVTPGQQALLDACTSRGMTIRAAPAVSPATPRVLMAAHPREELDACAQWARSELERQPGRRLGILVPALGRVQAELDRALTRVLIPRGAASGAGPLWEFSLGSPLADAPVVKAAMLLLQWTARPLDRTEAQWLLGSGFLAPTAADADALARMTFERSLVPGIALATVATGRQLPATVRAGLQALQSFARTKQFATAERTFAAWADLAQEALRASPWPGHRESTSRQFQAQQRFEHLLDELALLAFDASRVRWDEFLQTLHMHARNTLFTLETRDAPIQIMGAFEASGLRFDAVWFLGVDDGQWPATGRPHPLLPMWLQRAHGMPHAEPEADWTLGRLVTVRVAASAPEVTISYAREDKGIALRPSPLIAAVFPEAAGEAGSASAPRAPTARVEHFLGQVLEQVDDDSGVIAWPRELAAGGADTLRRQAACAFQSFATKRLQLRADREEVLGLDAMERGSLLHKVLEHLWSPVAGDPARLHSLDNLRQAIADESVTEMVAHHIDTVFAEAFALELGPPSATDPWSAAYIDVEKARLKRLLLEWLESEATREPFTVAELERELNDVDVHGLRFNLRIDRIDLLEDGTRLLMDYKTSKISAAKWSGERPDEPQLPLYYTHGGVTNVAGVAFAQLRVGAAELIAHAEQPGAVLAESKSVAPLTSIERQEWSDALASLAGAFRRGEAIVNPKQKAKTCEYCGLQGLCRVQEVQELQAVMLDEDDQD